MPPRGKLSLTGQIWEDAAERVTLRSYTRTRLQKLLVLAVFAASIAAGAGIAWLAKALGLASG